MSLEKKEGIVKTSRKKCYVCICPHNTKTFTLLTVSITFLRENVHDHIIKQSAFGLSEKPGKEIGCIGNNAESQLDESTRRVCRE
jgi:hypothetical protein